MLDRELKRIADDLEAQIEAGRPERHDARAVIVGEPYTTGEFRLKVSLLEDVVKQSADEPDAALLSRVLLKIHGWTFISGGRLVGPSAWPGGELGEMPGFDAGPETGSETSAGGGGGTVSRSAARREIKAIRTWTEWAAEVRSKDLWEWAQNRRALFIGRFVLPSYLRDPGLLANTRRRVAESGNEVHVELWSDEDLEADYTPAELGR